MLLNNIITVTYGENPLAKWIVGAVITVLYMWWLYSSGKNNKSSTPFYLILFIPFILPVLLFLIAMMVTGQGRLLLAFLLMIYFLWVVLWGMTLYVTASEGEQGWFILIYILPFMWIVYRIRG